MAVPWTVVPGPTDINQTRRVRQYGLTLQSGETGPPLDGLLHALTTTLHVGSGRVVVEGGPTDTGPWVGLIDGGPVAAVIVPPRAPWFRVRVTQAPAQCVITQAFALR